MHLKLIGRINGDHRMIEVAEYSFNRHPSPIITYGRFEPTTLGPVFRTHEVAIETTVYVLNDNGKTIETISVPQTDRKTP